MKLSGAECVRRFLIHVLPRGFVRIRCFAFLANRRRDKLLPLCHPLLSDNPRPQTPAVTYSSPTQPTCFRCPKCGIPMVVVERLSSLTNCHRILWSPALASSLPTFHSTLHTR